MKNQINRNFIKGGRKLVDFCPQPGIEMFFFIVFELQNYVEQSVFNIKGI